MARIDEVKEELKSNPKTWLITGCAGFIGSNLLEALLKLDQTVVGLDNFSTGFQYNLDQVKALVTEEEWNHFTFIEGDIRNIECCENACVGIDFVLHQAALGSVPRSIADPLTTNSANIAGFLNMLVASRDAKVKSFTYAASSSTYGDHPALPKVEENIGKPLSPYAVTKYVNELYADVFARNYDFKAIGLRYFNVFGPRQNPNGSYAAVIPKWTLSMLKGKQIYINGDGDTSRDFCFVENVIQMNILAATTDLPNAKNQVFNTALNNRTTLNQLFEYIKARLPISEVKTLNPCYRDFRSGDVRHSQADITKAQKLLGYAPTHDIKSGLDIAVKWYIENLGDV